MFECFARNLHFRRSNIAAWESSAFLRSFAKVFGSAVEKGFRPRESLPGVCQRSACWEAGTLLGLLSSAHQVAGMWASSSPLLFSLGKFPR